MSATSLFADRPHDSYRHEAFFFHGNRQFLAATVPFLREAVTAGQPAMAAVTAGHLEQLRSALGPQAEHVEFLDMAELGANPARIIPAWFRFLDAGLTAGRQPRGVGEPIWAGRRPAEVVECQLHEALLNLAVAPDTPLWLRCPYDSRALDAAVLAEAHRSHPVLVGPDGYRGSQAYGGAHHVDAMLAAELAEPAVPADSLEFRIGDLAAVAALVGDHAARARLSAPRTAALVTAAREIADNSVRHGGGGGLLRVWAAADALVCEIRDAGHLADPLVGRRPPRPGTTGGGLWTAHQVCDLVQIRSTAGGTVVRLLTWL